MERIASKGRRKDQENLAKKRKSAQGPEECRGGSTSLPHKGVAPQRERKTPLGKMGENPLGGLKKDLRANDAKVVIWEKSSGQGRFRDMRKPRGTWGLKRVREGGKRECFLWELGGVIKREG